MASDRDATRNRRQHRSGMVALADLLKQEHLIERIEKVEKNAIPVFVCGESGQSKKGEDFALVKIDCERIPGDGSSTFGVFAIFDGHNGSAAAVHAKEHLLKDVMSALPSRLDRDEWLSILPEAMIKGFLKTDRDFQQKGQTSGTTVSLVIVDRWTVTVASVGDSRCVLDTEAGVMPMTVDHRLDDNEAERQRIVDCGGEVGRLSTALGVEYGPLRCWPGGLCLSRSIGDADVGEYIVAVPFVKQVKLPKTGGRIIIASDGVWDALSTEKAAKCCRGLPPNLAAKHIVKEALGVAGLRDDTTCLVVDVIPPYKPHQNGRSSSESAVRRPLVLEVFEEGSANLAERTGFQSHRMENTVAM
ncbi:probable protein phosphatase 2C 15 [Selaginella moellendorffii]|uniref:probable protein phosphatase 2C 15 n=1 Tax=Selaginella moellendorffii TaxID=88036 RepID=UPI000D1C9875|nr:probable protein phosphatase 2C 15 [Selaginella moellendorffii]|eukprot:XP_024531793.1 probable protein phosphatase 2C 15 [Selaginella moellendorffii]